MTKGVALPFFQLDDDVVEAGPWCVQVDDRDVLPLDGYVSDVDYASQIHLTRSVRVQHALASTQLDIPEDQLGLVLCCLVGTGVGRLPRSILERKFLRPPRDGTGVEISVTVDGQKLSSMLQVATDVLLVSSSADSGPLSPTMPGSRLWRDQFALRLEGAEPRFPIEQASFKHMFGNGPEARAPWFVHWLPGEWQRDFHGAIRLYLNSDQPETLERVRLQDPDVLRNVLADVMSQVVECLLRQEQEPEEILADCPPGSLGAMARYWLDMAGYGKCLAVASDTLLNSPGRFRAALMAAAELPEGKP